MAIGLSKYYSNIARPKLIIPYSGKFWVGENLGEFGDLLRICQSFTHQLLIASEIAIEAGLKSAKVFSRQNFPLYGTFKLLLSNTSKISHLCPELFHYTPEYAPGILDAECLSLFCILGALLDVVAVLLKYIYKACPL